MQLGAMLKSNTSLRVLELDFNRFGPRTAAALAQGLESNSTLKRLSLSGCKLTGEEANKPDHSGIAALASALASNTGLVSLGLFGCGLGSAGGRLLLEGLHSNAVLREVAIDPSDGITAADGSDLSDILASNAEAFAHAEIEGKKARAAARKAALDKIAEEKAVAQKKAEVEWIGMEAEARKTKREQDQFDKYKKLRLEEMERERREKERWARFKAEAEEAAKKAKKK